MIASRMNGVDRRYALPPCDSTISSTPDRGPCRPDRCGKAQKAAGDLTQCRASAAAARRTLIIPVRIVRQASLYRLCGERRSLRGFDWRSRPRRSRASSRRKQLQVSDVCGGAQPTVFGVLLDCCITTKNDPRFQQLVERCGFEYDMCSSINRRTLVQSVAGDQSDAPSRPN
jgi:hypothetical protein